MIEPKNLKGLVAQAKTFDEWTEDYILVIRTATLEQKNQASKKEGRKKFVPVAGLQQTLSLLSEKERTLRKLLENRPKSEDYPIAYIVHEENTEKVIAHRKAVEQWFEVFVGEFEGLRELLCERPSLEKEQEKNASE